MIKDIHLSNILVKLPSTFNHLSVTEFYEKYGEPETVPITQQNGEPLPPNVPPKAVLPLDLGIPANEFKLQDSNVLLTDFGESYSPSSEIRYGEHCRTPLDGRPPEAYFEPQRPLSFSADIWSLAVTMWEILGMKALFSNEYITQDEMVSEHIDVLGPMPQSWFESWKERGEFFLRDDQTLPTKREIWPKLDQAFEHGIQSYRQKLKMGDFGGEETRAFLDLMRVMLTFPEERPTIEEVLKSEWMVKWVMPDYERAQV